MNNICYYVRDFSFVGEDGGIYTGLFKDYGTWARTPCIPATYHLLGYMDTNKNIYIVNQGRHVLMYSSGANRNLVCSSDIEALHYFESVYVKEMNRDRSIFDEIYEVFDAASDRQAKDYEYMIDVLEKRIEELERDLEYYMDCQKI